MATLVASLFSASVPAGPLVWADSGAFVALALALALVGTVLGMFAMRERPRRSVRLSGVPALKHRDASLPSPA